MWQFYMIATGISNQNSSKMLHYRIIFNDTTIICKQLVLQHSGTPQLHSVALLHVTFRDSIVTQCGTITCNIQGLHSHSIALLHVTFRDSIHTVQQKNKNVITKFLNKSQKGVEMPRFGHNLKFIFSQYFENNCIHVFNIQIYLLS